MKLNWTIIRRLLIGRIFLPNSNHLKTFQKIWNRRRSWATRNLINYSKSNNQRKNVQPRNYFFTVLNFWLWQWFSFFFLKKKAYCVTSLQVSMTNPKSRSIQSKNPNLKRPLEPNVRTHKGSSEFTSTKRTSKWKTWTRFQSKKSNVSFRFSGIGICKNWTKNGTWGTRKAVSSWTTLRKTGGRSNFWFYTDCTFTEALTLTSPSPTTASATALWNMYWTVSSRYLPTILRKHRKTYTFPTLGSSWKWGSHTHHQFEPWLRNCQRTKTTSKDAGKDSAWLLSEQSAGNVHLSVWWM